MALFDEQVNDSLLSDESLFAESENSDEQQVEMSDESNSVESQTEDDKTPAVSEQEQAAEETQETSPEVKPEEKKQEPDPKFAELEQKLKTMQAAMTQSFQNRAELKRQNEEMARELELLKESKSAAQQLDPAKRKEALENMVTDPQGFIANAAAPLIQQRVDEIVRQRLQPIQAAETERRQTDEVAKALRDLQQDGFSQAGNADSLKELANMVEAIDPNWKQNPGLAMRYAALKLWGTPTIINQKQIDEAEARGREAALKELAEREAAKAAAETIPTSNLPQAESTPEDDIMNGIVNASGSHRLFD